MKFEELITGIQAAHHELQEQALRQINNSLTIRNILIGFYIVEFEQNGEERARYGAGLLKNIADRIKHIKGFSERVLYQCKSFYLNYPEILQTASAKLPSSLIPFADYRKNEMVEGDNILCIYRLKKSWKPL